MGRWAQQRRAGGGTPIVPAAGTFMTSVMVFDEFNLAITYNNPVDAAQFTPPNFKSNPSAEEATNVINNAGDQLIATFSAAIDSDSSLTFIGDVVDVLSPQTLPIT